MRNAMTTQNDDRAGGGDPWGVAGKTALVTGASSGLGRHFAGVLAANGARVVAAARRADRLGALVAEHPGRSITPVELDVRDRAGLPTAFPRIEAAYGPIEILVNNAGVGIIAPALEHSDDDWDAAFETNVRAAFLLSRLVVERRPDGGAVSIVNVASPAATVPSRDISAYAASKAALVQLTRVLALEWARENVRVNCLSPGHVATELHPELARDDVRAVFERRIPVGRLGRPDDLDSALLLLAGEGSRYITGALLPVDGGAGLA
jgi:NAD(P)-dependent dehydrogenase (short-subunit alcohol dehydrogenase family)